MNDGVGRILFQERFDKGGVANITLNELVTGVVCEFGKAIQVACVCEFIEVHDSAVGLFAKDLTNKFTADETGTARNEESTHETWLRHLN